jgi:hypothetical protein
MKLTVAKSIFACENTVMKLTSLPRPNEQRKVEKLLVKLAQVKPISAKPAPISTGASARTA